MGNGEQYIWKPPEDEEMVMHQNKAVGPLGAHTVDNIQPSAAVVSNKTPVCAPVSHCSRIQVIILRHSSPGMKPACDLVDLAARKLPGPRS